MELNIYDKGEYNIRFSMDDQKYEFHILCIKDIRLFSAQFFFYYLAKCLEKNPVQIFVVVCILFRLIFKSV